MIPIENIENLVKVIQWRARGTHVVELSAFDGFSDRKLAEILCVLAVSHLDHVDAAAEATT